MTRPSAGAFMPTLRPVKSTHPHMRRVWGDGDRASAAPPANPPPKIRGLSQTRRNAPIFSGKRAGGGGQTGSGDIQKRGFAIFVLNYAEYKTKFALFCAVIFKKTVDFYTNICYTKTGACHGGKALSAAGRAFSQEKLRKTRRTGGCIERSCAF